MAGSNVPKLSMQLISTHRLNLAHTVHINHKRMPCKEGPSGTGTYAGKAGTLYNPSGSASTE